MNDLKHVRPYGDTWNDGAMQLSFSLPVPFGEEAKETARQYVAKLGLLEPQVVHGADLGEAMSFFVVYAKSTHDIDFTSIKVPKVESPVLDFYEINQFIKEHIGRKVVIVGACTGTDAHTVGIDAIMNMKGYAGEYGLERYPEVDAYNMGSQVSNEALIARAQEVHADAILVSQVVTQKDVHLPNLTELVDMLEAQGLRQQMIVICGGPRLNHEVALELGYDAGFGAGTLAPDVASFVVHEMVKRKLAGNE